MKAAPPLYFKNFTSGPGIRFWRIIAYLYFTKSQTISVDILRIQILFLHLHHVSDTPKHLERWQSGRLRRSWKPLTVTGPGVRIPLSLQDMMSKHSKTPFKRFKRGFWFLRTIKKFKNSQCFLTLIMEQRHDPKWRTKRHLTSWLARCSPRKHLAFQW